MDEEQKFSLSGTVQKGKEYIDAQIELLKLKAIARGSRMIGSLVLDVSKLILTLFVVFFLSMAFAFFLGEMMNSYALGFLTTGGIFILLIVIVCVTETKLEAKFMDLSIRKLLGKWNEEDDDTQPENEKKHEESFENK
ncbi:phage holin family protein [Sphingobacterium sp. SYP-B4668]|uniref:phage holin family protein n=1 Tax=Sphingobacterium sp. SYP-B4668 TaxID=2996035 RepID=UPI0005326004|nr:phage holin family protein [Sphingobacterium sp. SYP-B4668]